jgi:hypothetical protein
LNTVPVVGSCRSGFELTRRLTGIDCVGFVAPGAEMSIFPVHVPGCKPLVLICTLSVLGVELL